MPAPSNSKKDFGINQASLIPETIKPILSSIKAEARQLIGIYQARGRAFDKIIIVGGSANLRGWMHISATSARMSFTAIRCIC